ncbi:hypothetical protein ABLV89_01150 [Staphylococcus equorum]
MEILKKEKYFEQSKYKLLNENTEKNDLNYILSSISNDATFDLKIGGINKKVVLDDNMKKFIKETIKPMIKLYMSK